MTSKQLFFALIFVCALHIRSFGQERNMTSFLNFGYDRIGSSSFIKAGYKVTFTKFGEWERNFHTLTADISLSPFDSKTFVAPSLTYNFYGLFYYTGLNASYFVGDNKQDLRIAPQIGLTYFNVLNIGYSYYIPTSSINEINVIGTHSFNISISIPVGFLFSR
jgi:hypothetical protein